jgi:hypothetical protein
MITVWVEVVAIVLLLTVMSVVASGLTGTFTGATNFGPGREGSDGSHGPTELSAARASLRGASPMVTPHPSPRWGAGMVYDSADAAVLLFVGYGPSGVLGDTWEFSGGNWSQILPSVSPTPRQFPAMSWDAADNYTLLFGGTPSPGVPFVPLNDTWKFAGGTWTQLAPANPPPRSWQASMADDVNDGYVVLFGGLDKTSLGQTWEFNAGQWTALTPSTHPAARGLASMAYDAAARVVVLFGGINAAAKIFGDTWTYSAGVWGRLTTTVHPSARYGAGFTGYCYPNCQPLVLFGGSVGSSVSSQTWTYDSGAWTLNRSALHPPARLYEMIAPAPTGVVGSLCSSCVLLFGGEGVSMALAGTWTFAPPIIWTRL